MSKDINTQQRATRHFIKEDDMKRAKLNNDKITVLYCRLSKDDGTHNEGMRISIQKTMLKEYAKRNGFLNCQFYVEMKIA